MRVFYPPKLFIVETSKLCFPAVTVLRSTWGSGAGMSIAYYSDSEDPAYSTINTGIPNTERGQPKFRVW